MSFYELAGISPKLPAAGDYWVASSASIIGDVELATGVSIWFGAVLRGDTETIRVGLGSNVQDLCVLHTDHGFPLEIGENCTIGHRAILHGCKIGSNSLIGMGAVILNGATIGKDCLIGAGALVTEGKVIPDGSLVIGAPGKVSRALSVAEIAQNTASAVHYQANMRRFRSNLVLIG